MDAPDELCLNNEVALQVFFLRAGIPAGEAKELAWNAFAHYPGSGWPASILPQTNTLRIVEVLDKKVLSVRAQIESLQEQAASLGEYLNILEPLVDRVQDATSLQLTEDTVAK